MAVSSRPRWGDTLDDDDVGFLPPTEVTGPDAKGIKTIVEYKRNDKGDTVKVTTRIKIVKMDKKQYEVSLSSHRAQACRLPRGPLGLGAFSTWLCR